MSFKHMDVLRKLFNLQRDFTPIISRRTRRASVVILLRVRPDNHPLALSHSPTHIPNDIVPSPYQGLGPHICGAFFEKSNPSQAPRGKVPKFSKDDQYMTHADASKPLPDLTSAEFTDPASILQAHAPEGAVKGDLVVERWLEQEWVRNGHLELLFMRRAPSRGDRWSGQVGFPGGRRQDSETDIEAAVREVFEETGLSLGDRRQFTWLGRMHDINVEPFKKVKPLAVATFIFLQLTPTTPPMSLSIKEAAKVIWTPVDFFGVDTGAGYTVPAAAQVHAQAQAQAQAQASAQAKPEGKPGSTNATPISNAPVSAASAAPADAVPEHLRSFSSWWVSPALAPVKRWPRASDVSDGSHMGAHGENDKKIEGETNTTESEAKTMSGVGVGEGGGVDGVVNTHALTTSSTSSASSSSLKHLSSLSALSSLAPLTSNPDHRPSCSLCPPPLSIDASPLSLSASSLPASPLPPIEMPVAVLRWPSLPIPTHDCSLLVPHRHKYTPHNATYTHSHSPAHANIRTYPPSLVSSSTNTNANTNSSINTSAATNTNTRVPLAAAPVNGHTNTNTSTSTSTSISGSGSTSGPLPLSAPTPRTRLHARHHPSTLAALTSSLLLSSALQPTPPAVLLLPPPVTGAPPLAVMTQTLCPHTAANAVATANTADPSTSTTAVNLAHVNVAAADTAAASATMDYHWEEALLLYPPPLRTRIATHMTSLAHDRPRVLTSLTTGTAYRGPVLPWRSFDYLSYSRAQQREARSADQRAEARKIGPGALSGKTGTASGVSAAGAAGAAAVKAEVCVDAIGHGATQEHYGNAGEDRQDGNTGGNGHRGSGGGTATHSGSTSTSTSAASGTPARPRPRALAPLPWYPFSISVPCMLLPGVGLAHPAHTAMGGLLGRLLAETRACVGVGGVATETEGEKKNSQEKDVNQEGEHAGSGVGSGSGATGADASIGSGGGGGRGGAVESVVDVGGMEQMAGVDTTGNGSGNGTGSGGDNSNAGSSASGDGTSASNVNDHVTTANSTSTSSSPPPLLPQTLSHTDTAPLLPFISSPEGDPECLLWGLTLRNVSAFAAALGYPAAQRFLHSGAATYRRQLDVYYRYVEGVERVREIGRWISGKIWRRERAARREHATMGGGSGGSGGGDSSMGNVGKHAPPPVLAATTTTPIATTGIPTTVATHMSTRAPSLANALRTGGPTPVASGKTTELADTRPHPGMSMESYMRMGASIDEKASMTPSTRGAAGATSDVVSAASRTAPASTKTGTAPNVMEASTAHDSAATSTAATGAPTGIGSDAFRTTTTTAPPTGVETAEGPISVPDPEGEASEPSLGERASEKKNATPFPYPYTDFDVLASPSLVSTPSYMSHVSSPVYSLLLHTTSGAFAAPLAPSPTAASYSQHAPVVSFGVDVPHTAAHAQRRSTGGGADGGASGSSVCECGCPVTTPVDTHTSHRRAATHLPSSLPLSRSFPVSVSTHPTSLSSHIPSSSVHHLSTQHVFATIPLSRSDCLHSPSPQHRHIHTYPHTHAHSRHTHTQPNSCLQHSCPQEPKRGHVVGGNGVHDHAAGCDSDMAVERDTVALALGMGASRQARRQYGQFCLQHIHQQCIFPVGVAGSSSLPVLPSSSSSRGCARIATSASALVSTTPTLVTSPGYMGNASNPNEVSMDIASGHGYGYMGPLMGDLAATLHRRAQL